MNKLKILGTLLLVLCCSTILVGQTSFSIPDSSLTVGESILIPVAIDIDTTENVFGIHMNITYDTTIVEFLGTVRMGSISENVTTASNEKNGRVLISMAAINPIKESGDLIYLEFTALNVGNSALSIVEYRINENSIIYSDERGSVKVFDENGNQPPFIVQIPDTLSFYSNDTLEVFIDESLFADAEDNFTDLKITFTIDPLVVIPIYSADTGLLTITTLDYSGIATLNILVEDCEIFILKKDKKHRLSPSYTKLGNKKPGGINGESIIEKGETLEIHHVKNKQRLMFVLNEIDYRQKGFEVTFDHGIECTCRVRFKNKKAMILIKIIDVDSHKTGIMTHIAGNIGHPDWKKKD
jgi:hypothetical protein